MGAGFWVVAVAAGVGGYFAYRGLQAMEKDIREEIASAQEAAVREKDHPPAPAPTPPAPPEKAPPTNVTLEDQVQNLIRTRAGLLQVDLYRELSRVNRKELQELLLRLDRSGKIRRVKEKSTYKLFPT